jgi:hypothetical protein
VNGARLIADVSGVAFEPDTATLLVADLHFEKGSAFAARGQLLPPYDTRETIRRLSDAIVRLGARRVFALGDSFHDLGADGRMHDSDADALAGLVASVEDWLWIEGNHDPDPPARFGGRTAAETRLGPLTLRHEPVKGPPPARSPATCTPARASRCGGAVFAGAVSPRMGRVSSCPHSALHRRLNVCDPAWRGVFETRPTAWMLGDGGVFPIAGHRLRGD